MTSAAPAFAQQDPATVDPYEKLNRKSFAFTEKADKAVIGPAARTYLKAPKPARDGVHNVLTNLNEPLNVLNYLLQLKPKKAVHDTARFVVNTTIGVAGVFDNAKRLGLDPKPTDFGATFARYGAGPGAYVYIPLYGPSTVRDSLGLVGGLLLDPVNWPRYRGKTAITWTRVLVTGLDTRANVNDLLVDVRTNSVDPYASLRSLYLQNRAAELSGGKVDLESLPSFDDGAEGPPPGPDAAPGPEAAPAPEPAPAPPPEPAPAN